jgi:FdhD protein
MTISFHVCRFQKQFSDHSIPALIKSIHEIAFMQQGNTKNRDLYSTIKGYRYSKGVLEPKLMAVAKEVPITLFVNDREILSIATLPSHLKELFVGFLVSEGVILSKEEIKECHVDYDSRITRLELTVPDERIKKIEKKGMLTSGCAGGVVFSVEANRDVPRRRRAEFEITTSSILKRMQELDTYSGIYHLTRGVHASSVVSMENTIATMEDLGRHNAVDKIAGFCFLNEIHTWDKMLLTTGRITSEVLTKAARSSFPIVISRSSASALAIKIAQGAGIDVITYVRGGSFNYFHHGATKLICA